MRAYHKLCSPIYKEQHMEIYVYIVIMPPRIYSRFIFETNDNLRTFRHQRIVNELHLDCPTCLSVVDASEPYSHHWLNNQDASHIKLSLAEKLLLERIEREGIQTFLLCDESATERTQDFLLEAGMEAVPQLLRFLYYEATRLELSIGFYVNVKHTRMYFESSSVAILHHLDISETVDVLFSLLLQKVNNYMLLRHGCNMESCSIKRLKLIVKRFWQNGEMHLPLQYRINSNLKPPATSHAASVDLSLLAESYTSNLEKPLSCYPPSLQVNLYCLRVCASSKELYVVPYLLRSNDMDNTPTFLIQTNVLGGFRGFHEIRNVRRLLEADLQDHMFECRQCNSHISERAQYVLHNQINCGRDFIVLRLEENAIELHENCLGVPRQYFKHAWFGIGKSKAENFLSTK